MKVILLRDVAKIGRKNSVVEVPDGYALNQLIPKRWAEAATPANLKKIASVQASKDVQYQNDQARFDDAAARLSRTPLTIVALQANDQGHLFKAIHEADIVTAAKSLGAMLEIKEIQIDQPLKSLGQHQVTLKHGSKTAPCVIDIIKK